MPTDSGGIYSLPLGYLAVTGETIEASQHNPPLEDIRDALTNRLPRNGAAPMTAALKMGANKITGLADGAAATDGAAFGQINYLKKLAESVKTNDYTILPDDAGRMLIANKATAIAFALPAVSGVTSSAFFVRNIGVGDLTLDGDGAETIEGAATYVLKTGQGIILWANATVWKVFAGVRRFTTADNTIPRFDGINGDLQPSTAVINDDGSIAQVSTGATTLPVGTTAQRPTGSIAMARENLDANLIPVLEHHNGTTWRTLDRPFLHLQDQQTSGTNGGTFTSGAWRTRVLTTEVTDEIGAALSNNQITLPAGTYEISARAPAMSVGVHQARLLNVTAGSVVLLLGASCTSSDGQDFATTDATVHGRFTLAVPSDVRLEHRCGFTQNTYGFGIPTSWGTEVYAEVMIWRVQ